MRLKKARDAGWGDGQYRAARWSIVDGNGVVLANVRQSDIRHWTAFVPGSDTDVIADGPSRKVCVVKAMRALGGDYFERN